MLIYEYTMPRAPRSLRPPFYSIYLASPRAPVPPRARHTNNAAAGAAIVMMIGSAACSGPAIFTNAASGPASHRKEWQALCFLELPAGRRD